MWFLLIIASGDLKDTGSDVNIKKWKNFEETWYLIHGLYYVEVSKEFDNVSYYSSSSLFINDTFRTTSFTF